MQPVLTDRLGVAEVDHGSHPRPLGEQPPQGLGVARLEPLVGDDAAQVAAGSEQAQAALEEVDVEVRHAVVGGEALLEGALVRALVVEPHLAQVGDHDPVAGQVGGVAVALLDRRPPSPGERTVEGVTRALAFHRDHVHGLSAVRRREPCTRLTRSTA